MGKRQPGLLDGFREGLEAAAKGAEALAGSLAFLAEPHRQRIRAAAAELGLEVDDRWGMVGTWDGVPVRRYAVDRGSSKRTDLWTYTDYTLAAALPGKAAIYPRGLAERLSELFGIRDVTVGSPLDAELWVLVAAGQHEDVRRLLTDQHVVDRLTSLTKTGAQWRLGDSKLTVGFRGRYERVGARGLRLGAEVTRAFDRLLVPPWQALARDLGSHLDLAQPRLAGHVGHVPVRVEVRLRKGAPTTWLLAWFEPHLPAGTHVAHRSRLSRGSPLGDAIYDPMVRAEGSDLDELVRRLATDAVRGPLLEVVHGFPGSSLRHDRVMLRMPGRVGPTLPERVRLVVELATALSGSR